MKKILIWGIGNIAKRLMTNGIYGELLGFIETNKTSEVYWGKRVYDINEIPEEYDFIIVANSFVNEIYNICNERKIPLEKMIFLKGIKKQVGYSDRHMIQEILGKNNYIHYCSEFGLDEASFLRVSAANISASICNKECFRSIKNCNEGKMVVLCGAGSTLQKYVPISGAVHVALNRALLYKRVKYDWFIADDWDGINFFQEEIVKYDCIKFFGRHFLGDCECEIPESFRIACKARHFYSDLYLVGNGFDSKFICDIDTMAIGNMPNIALEAMQIVLFSHPSKIYLVGCDASEGHFIQPPNLDKIRIKKHKEDLKMAVSSDRVIQKWYELKEFADTFYPDIEIISFNPVGLKGIFKDEYQN